MYLYYCDQLGLIKELFLMIWVPFLSPFYLLFQINESQEILILAGVYIITKKMPGNLIFVPGNMRKSRHFSKMQKSA